MTRAELIAALDAAGCKDDDMIALDVDGYWECENITVTRDGGETNYFTIGANYDA